VRAPYRFCLMFLLTLCTGAASNAADRIALVIGNSEYSDSPLANPANDARLIAASLKDVGFDVVEHLNADQITMKRAIQNFGDRLDEAGKDATGLFYYAGHGVQVGGENYLIPVDAAIKRESDVTIEAVSTTAVLAVLDFARNELNLVIMDACRNNPFARSFRSATRGLARMDAPRGTLIAYATAPGDVAQDGAGDNSPYSAALAEAMQRPSVPVEQMFKTVRRDVMAETANAQVPWEASSLTGDFFFQDAPAEGEVARPVAVPQAQIDKESLFWQSIEDSEDSADFEEYLRLFPRGIFSGLARNRVTALSGEAPEAADQITTTQVETAVKADEPVEKDLSGMVDTTTAVGQPATQIAHSAAAILPKSRGIEREPNQTRGTANRINESSIIRGRIDPTGDVDWYRMSVQQQAALKVHITEVAPELDMSFRVWNDEYGAISGWYGPLRAGGETEATVDLPAPGDYIVEVRDGSNDASSNQPYNMDITAIVTNDAYEPNNAFGTAPTVGANAAWHSTILPIGDVDWYRVNVDRQGELTMRVSEVAENLDVSLRIWNGEKGAITGWYSPFAIGGDTEATVDLPAAGLYALEVRDGSNDQRSELPFVTTLSYRPTEDRFEPNNSIGTAKPLAIGEQVQATVLPKGDVDWYRVDVDDQGELGVSITDVPQNLDIAFRVWNANVSAISGWLGPLRAGGDTLHNFDLGAPGPYLIEVRDGSNDARSVEPYTIALSYKPTNDRGEPNNSFGTALPLKLGTAISATILPKGDADWYRISAGRPGNLNLHISESPPDLDMSMRVWNNEKQAISGWLGPLRAGGEAIGEVAIPGAGIYFIEVRDGSNDNRSPLAYRLQVRMSN